ncbi:hypothetical protein [Bowmanella pacifica]|uniref:Uncharacterized protein n=1 Tax=Bowmanella pacifica TaxID=502051 RepID=A0A917YSF2_9ALTE|nr:hypothetical protein GCM10010982_03520 [Bowmanella pacifica]
MFKSQYSKLSMGLLLGLSSLCAQADSKAPQPAADAHPPTLSQWVKTARYIVRFRSVAPSIGMQKKGTGPQVFTDGKFADNQAKALLENAGAQVLLSLPEHHMMAANLNLKALKALSDNPQIASIEEDPRRFPMA